MWTSSHACVLSHFNRVQLFVTPMDCNPLDPSVHGILQARYWNGFLCPHPGDLPDPGMEPTLLMSPAQAGGFFTTSATWEVLWISLGAII